jgi:hypothetical protein
MIAGGEINRSNVVEELAPLAFIGFANNRINLGSQAADELTDKKQWNCTAVADDVTQCIEIRNHFSSERPSDANILHERGNKTNQGSLLLIQQRRQSLNRAKRDCRPGGKMMHGK